MIKNILHKYSNMTDTLVYWIGVIGIPGKGGGHYMEKYNPDRTIGQIIQTMTANGLVERNKRVEILKHQYGNINKYDMSAPYWHHNAKLSELMCGHTGVNAELICVFI